MKDFVAIDFETANRERTSICSVGLVRVENGDIREKIYRLIRPYPDYYSSWNTRIHGLTYRDTRLPFRRFGPTSLRSWRVCRW